MNNVSRNNSAERPYVILGKAVDVGCLMLPTVVMCVGLFELPASRFLVAVGIASGMSFARLSRLSANYSTRKFAASSYPYKANARDLYSNASIAVGHALGTGIGVAFISDIKFGTVGFAIMMTFGTRALKSIPALWKQQEKFDGIKRRLLADSAKTTPSP